MANTNSQSNCIERIRKILKLRSNECMLKDGSIVVEPEKGKEKLVIEVNISRILKMCNSKRFKFRNCIFKEPIILKQITFGEILYFINSTFEGEVDFSYSLFKERVFFSESTFSNKASFAEVIFEQNAYFDEARFLGEADFGLSEFNKNAHFYGAQFRKIKKEGIEINDIPNFLQAIFNGGINLTNTKLGLTFELVEDKIKETYEEKASQYRREKDAPRRYKVANEFRNVFKNIKDGLIRGNNLLDASLFHKMELYAKELELKYKKEEAEEESGIRDTVDKIQLMLYRVTSDHHTDLMLILTNVLALIVLFAITSITLLFCADYLLKWIGINDECHVLEQIRCLFAMLPKHIHEYIKPIVWGEITIIITLCATFVYVFKCIVCHIYAANNNKKLHCCFIVVFLANAFILAVKPAIMLPIFGKLIDESLKIDFPAFTSLSIVYAILMFLLIWSLQKTARKNTIVPN
ncbi:MAG: pentapeptide repeat-containing protein [Helicobacter sp.]|nr:pentapeptide repeat-containing protein [Helicobacter sp.]